VAEAKIPLAKKKNEASLYPLAASKKKLEEKAGQENEEEMVERMTYVRRPEQPTTPASAVTQNGFIQAGAYLIGNSGSVFE
jgi:hypothetical protein